MPIGGGLFLIGGLAGALVFLLGRGPLRAGTAAALAFAAAALRLAPGTWFQWAPLAEGAFFVLVPLALLDWAWRAASRGLRRAQIALSPRCAVRSGNADALRAHLLGGAHPESPDEEKTTYLHEACAAGHEEAARILLAFGARVDARDRFRRTPLHLAAAGGHAGCAAALRAYGADVSAADSDGATPAETARAAGHEDLFRELDDAARGLA